MATAKVTVNGTTIVDMTDATATADKILAPYTAYGADGSKITGTASGGGGANWDDPIRFFDYDGVLVASYTSVPSESLSAYQTATNWSTYASYMQGEQ